MRLEIRRVTGRIRNDQVYWGEGPDGLGICVCDMDGITIVDDAAQDMPPRIIFEFKFREDLKITERMIEENMDTKIGVRRRSYWMSSTDSRLFIINGIKED